MCGIIAYKGEKDAVSIVVDGLKKLEYRGYDSWGVGVKQDSGIKLIKEVGKIGEVDTAKLWLKESRVAVGHTRWATHGGVTKINAHPHLSNNKKIVVVHNGIVENYQELKDFLINNGFSFASQTDTEVIPNLIEYHLSQGTNFVDSVMNALREIEGSYAVVILSLDSDELIGARRGSPLVVGVGNGEYFLASDVPAFLEHTNQVVYLEDDEMVIINNDVRFYDLVSDEQLRKEIKEINWSIEQAQKGNYEHFMLKEIHEQKFTIRKAIEQSPELIQKVSDMINNAFGVFFVGCGTSYHACVSAGYEFASIAKKHVNVVLASEFRNYEDFLTDRTLMITVSQSGETADVLDAVRVAKRHGVKIIAVINVMGSTLSRIADETILMNAGPEICVLSTKSYTSQLAILLLLAYSVAGKTEQGKKLVLEASKHVEKVIEENTPVVRGLARKFKDSHDLFLIGRDLAFPSALEGALKVKEVSYIHAEGFAGAELKHGTIALIEQNVPVIVLVTEETKSLILSNAMEIKARGGYIIGVNEHENELYDTLIKVPSMSNADPILMIIPIQLLAYYLALERGCDVDHPRNLSKVVTVR